MVNGEWRRCPKGGVCVGGVAPFPTPPPTHPLRSPLPPSPDPLPLSPFPFLSLPLSPFSPPSPVPFLFYPSLICFILYTLSTLSLSLTRQSEEENDGALATLLCSALLC
eukprot:Sspe_Gene.60273::Locus_33193_Transcript_1_1_Confidence_1.000_Length_916::g.60273::m.60273